jgi:hypothetical protein
MADIVVLTVMGMAGLFGTTPCLIVFGVFVLIIEDSFAVLQSYLAYSAARPIDQIAALFGQRVTQGLLACIVSYLSGVLVSFLSP